MNRPLIHEIADRVRHQETASKARDYVRMVIARSIADTPRAAVEIASERWGSSSSAATILKAAVGAITTGGNLVGDEMVAASEFFRLADQGSILASLPLRRIPFRTRVLIPDDRPSAAWVGEGKAVPTSLPSYSALHLVPMHIAALTVQTKELLESIDPVAEAAVTDSLVRAVRDGMDTAFIDPTNAGSAGISPASITNGLTPITSTGNDADSVRTDLMALTAAYTGSWDTAALLMHPKTALALSLLQAPLGGALLAMPAGGNLFGITWIASGNVPDDIVVLVDAGDIVAGLGDGEIKSSQQGSVQMNDSPTMDASTGTGSTVVSMWQTNSVALMTQREANWTVAHSGAVVLLDSVEWGQPAASGA